MNDIAKHVLAILREEVSETLAKIALEVRAKKIGTTLESMTARDLRPLSVEIARGLSGYIGEGRAQMISEQIVRLESKFE